MLQQWTYNGIVYANIVDGGLTDNIIPRLEVACQSDIEGSESVRSLQTQ